MTMSQETRRKISESMKGRKKPPLSEEHKRKISESLKKRPPVSQQTREKISKALMGHAVSAETARKISSANRGKPKEHCQPGCSCGKHTGSQGSYVSINGYRVLTGVVNHLLCLVDSGISGKVFEHRKALWEKLGCQSLNCVHECHWCGASLSWDSIHSDHLNGDKLDNDPENLVPSCMSCNMRRGRAGNPVAWEGG